MTRKIFFQNSVNGQPSYTAEDFSAFFGNFVSNGILFNRTTGAGLSVSFAPESTKDDIKVIVQPGAICSNGKIGVFTEAEIIDLGAVGGELLTVYVSVVYNIDQKEIGFDTSSTKPTNSDKVFPIAKIKVYPKSMSRYTDMVEDLRQETGYVDGILTDTRTHETILDTAYGNINTLISQYKDLAQQVEDTGTATSIALHSQTVGASDLVDGEVLLTIPPTAKSIIGYDIYLNGRLYTGNTISVDIAQKKAKFTKLTDGNSAIINVFYVVGGDGNA